MPTIANPCEESGAGLVMPIATTSFENAIVSGTYSGRRFVVIETGEDPMSEAVVYLTQTRRYRTDWSTGEFGYLERAAHSVRKLGVFVETDHGVTDEGEPWFAICDADSDEVLVHFCKIRDRYVACAPFLESSLTGPIFPDLIERFLNRYAAVSGVVGVQKQRHPCNLCPSNLRRGLAERSWKAARR